MSEPPGLSVRLRHARASDAAGIAAAHIGAWRQAYAGLVSDNLLSGLSVVEATTRWTHRLTELDPQQIRVVVAEVDGSVDASPAWA